MRTSKYFLLIYFLFICLGIEADNVIRNWQDRYNITHLTIDDGLPHNFVDDLLKDSRGFLWIATRGEGLARYDGYEFISFNMGTSEGKLCSNFIHQLEEDDFCRLWIASEVGLDILDLKTLEVLEMGEENPSFKRLQNVPVDYLYHSAAGNMWICSQGVLFKVTFQQDGHIGQIIKVCEWPEEETIRAVCEVDEYLWVNYKDGVYRIKESSMKEQEPALVSESLRLPDVNITTICHCSNEVWIGSFQGLFRYNIDTESIRYYAHEADNPHSLSQNLVTDIVVTDEYNVIVSTFKGINLYHSMTDSFERINRDCSVIQNGTSGQNNLNCDFINCLLTDGHTIWVGTEIGGVNKINRRILYIQNFSHSNEVPGSISRNPVNAILEDKDGTLWVGTVEGGLNRKLSGQQTFTHYTTDAPTYLTHNSVSCFTMDREGLLWIGTWGGGFGWIDPHDESKRFHHIVSSEYADASTGFVGAICYDSLNHMVWVGTGNHLYAYNPKTSKTDKPFCLGGIDGCTGYLIEDGTHLWVGMTKGLCRIDLRTYSSGKPQYQLWEYKLDEPASKLPERVSDIIQASDGTIWVGSNGYGFYRAVPGDDGSFTFEGYTTSDGLACNAVRGLEEDKEGRIWITTTNGLSCFDPENVTFDNYTKKDGLLSNQFYWNAIGKSANGDIYLGSINGLSVIRPATDYGKPKATPILFTHLRVADKEVRPEKGAIHMHERDKSLSFEFAALDYNASILTSYSYRLKGFDDKWKKTTANHRVVTYTNLRAGNYTFEVRYAPNGSQWLDETAAMHIYVESYFYKTLWFNVLLVLVIASIVYGCFVWR